ncbi:MAG: chalcone isomerase family protein, partial [Rubrivivax sp.]
RLLVEVPAAEFVKAIDKGVARNTPAAQQPALAARRQQFDAAVLALGQVKKGDVVDLDYLPGRGLLFAHNGRARGDLIPGEDFYAALLRIFLGEHPVDDRLKAGLLGVAAP